MRERLRERLRRMEERLQELDRALLDPAVASDPQQLRRLGQERAELEPVVALWRGHRALEEELAATEALMADPELRALAEEEKARLAERLAESEHALTEALTPRDPEDDRPAFLEIRAGTGGEEAALFAADLLRMYLRYAERRGWRSEILSASESDLGGYREVIVRLEGRGVYGRLKFESGVHRVQRVPATESQGRIHTSACTVAVLPEPDEEAVVRLDPAELRIDTFRASGAGGQHVNRTDSAVRITHLPTGLVVECQDDRSQHRNKAKAMAVLAARLEARQRDEQAAAVAAARKSLVGSTSTGPIRRCASRTCPRGSWSNARTTARSIATRRRPWRCWRRGWRRGSGTNRPQRWLRQERAWWAAAIAPSASVPTISRRAG